MARKVLVGFFLSSVIATPWIRAGSTDASWRDQVSKGIDRAEYEFSRKNDGSWLASNRSQGLRTTVRAWGIEVVDRRAGANPAGGGWRLALSLTGYGRDGSVTPVEPAEPAPDSPRIAIRRGAIEEWYANDERGLEQGFTLAAPSAGDRSSAVMIDMTLGGNVLAYPTADGRGVLFKSGSGRPVLRYAGLRVTDACGDDLDARIEIRPGSLRIRFVDAGAAYPVQVDPVMSSPVWTVRGEQAGAQLGLAVSAAGDVDHDGYGDVLVGAPGFDGGEVDEGRVFLFRGSAAGLSVTPSWTAESNQAGAQFGAAVAPAGDVDHDGYSDVIIGAPSYKDASQPKGGAFVYRGSPGGLTVSPVWSAHGAKQDAQFGAAVGMAGDVDGDGFSDVIVGARGDGTQGEGKAYLFRGSAAGPSPTSTWSAAGGQASAAFGTSAAGAGDLNDDGYADIVVGAPSYSNGQLHEGRGFVYLGSPSGPATSASWTSEPNIAESHFGSAAGTAGDVNGDGYTDLLVGGDNAIGALETIPNRFVLQGGAYVFLGSAAGPAASATAIVHSGRASAGFGFAAAPAGDINGDGFADIIAGAPSYDDTFTDEGAAFVFLGNPSGLSTKAVWRTVGGQAGARLGTSVCAAGDVDGDGYGDVIVGANLFDGSFTDDGMAAVFLGSPSGKLTTDPVWQTEGNQASAYYGFRVGSAGDVNGDGFADVLVGAPSYDGAQVDGGRAFLYLGTRSGLSTTPAWTADGDQPGEQFGNSVSSAGDVDGDGYADVVIGAPAYDKAHMDDGGAFVYLGSPAGLSSTPVWSTDGNQEFGSFGDAVSSAGDVNGDGYGDVIVGMWGYHGPLGDRRGRVYGYYGSPQGLSPVPSWIGEGPPAGPTSGGNSFGTSVALAGDVNGDGYSDIVVGDPGYYTGLQGYGRAYVFQGSASGLVSTPLWTAQGEYLDTRFGTTVASAGDVDGDGTSDVLVGAPYYGHYGVSEHEEGKAYLYMGSPAGPGATPVWTLESNVALEHFPTGLGSAGDINRDGYDDVILGSGYNAAHHGQVSLFLGSASGIGTTPAWTAEGADDTSYLGMSVATAGDVDGDGFDDVLAGTFLQSNFDGFAYLFLGNEGTGLARTPRAARASGAAPVVLLGRSDAQDRFRLRARGSTPAGAGPVRMEWEVKPLGASFDGSGVGIGATLHFGGAAGPAPLDEVVSGLATGTPYRWRLRLRGEGPYFPGSQWLYADGNGRNLVDIRTACLDAPAGSVTIALAGPAGAAALSWGALPGATGYDVVRGNLGALREAAGDFAAATVACVASRIPGTTVTDGTTPPAGQGFWYVVRGVAEVPGVCVARGSFDSGASSQVASRDPGISASGTGCP